jgi:hypothetical protein
MISEVLRIQAVPRSVPNRIDRVEQKMPARGGDEDS